MTIAIANALLECNGEYSQLSHRAVEQMQKFGRKYPHAGYGGNFYGWIGSNNPQPYNSFGNGSAMRVSACAYAAIELARRPENKGKTIVALLPDAGDRYLSTKMFEE